MATAHSRGQSGEIDDMHLFDSCLVRFAENPQGSALPLLSSRQFVPPKLHIRSNSAPHVPSSLELKLSLSEEESNGTEVRGRRGRWRRRRRREDRRHRRWRRRWGGRRGERSRECAGRPSTSPLPPPIFCAPPVANEKNQASCGESISALLSSSGHLYTSGSSEFGQLGNGETGEHIVQAGKLGYSNCAKFVRRSAFVQSESDRDGVLGRTMMTSGSMDSKGKVKTVSLEDAGRIRLAGVSCGRNHLVAVEASATGHVPRVFSWGCGDYGCLGHGLQADEYTPRLVGAFRGPVFANNPPVSAVAGGNCTLVLTRNGHVYYVGRHKSTGEATMRPTLVDALANNGHVVSCVGAGSQTVFCSTRGGVTVSWGNGSHGELGYGKDEKKSSAKPEFVGGLDSCMVTDVACGMGHTLFIVRNEDEEDAKALKKVGRVEEGDLGYFLEQIKGKKVDAGADGEPAKKKQKGKGKK